MLLEPEVVERLLRRLEEGIIPVLLSGVVREFLNEVCGYTPSLGDDYDLGMALFSLSGQRVRVVIEVLE